MKYANNPQTFMNGFYSSSRNVFLTVSIAVAMYGFSSTFKLGVSVGVIKDMSLLIFIFSFMLGVNNIHIFYNYIKALEKERDNGEVLPIYVNLKLWRRYLYIKIYFMILLIILIIASSRRLFNRRFFN
tara:strand:+ start:556 stop:939 length:384 start_codon:yes stop_codon:yes gene_type:complete